MLVLAHLNGPSIVRGHSDGFRGAMAPSLACARGCRGFGLGRAVLPRYGPPGPLCSLGRHVLPALHIGPQRRGTDGHRSNWIRGDPSYRARPRLDPRMARGAGSARIVRRRRGCRVPLRFRARPSVSRRPRRSHLEFGSHDRSVRRRPRRRRVPARDGGANRPRIPEGACDGCVRRGHVRRGRPDVDRGLQRIGRLRCLRRLRALPSRTASRSRGVRPCRTFACRLGGGL